MGQAIGESITFAVVIALSPIPIIAIVLLLLSKRAGANGIAFVVGWVVGLTAALTAVILVSGSIGTGTDTSPKTGTSALKLLLGALLLYLALRSWRGRPAPGEPADLPPWLSAVETISPVKAAGIGMLGSLNPKNVILILGGGIAIAGGTTSTADRVVAAAVFVAIASASVVVPVGLYHALGDRIRPPLQALDQWLRRHSATVMAAVLLVIGVALLGNGLSGF
jgi:hypothetical protein